MKLHEDEHSVTSISDIVNNINLRQLSQKKCHSHMANLANMPMSHVHIWPHTEQQQAHKIKSKCHLNVLYLKK